MLTDIYLVYVCMTICMYDSNKCKLYLVTVWLAVPRWSSELSIPLSYGGVCCLFFFFTVYAVYAAFVWHLLAMMNKFGILSDR